MRLRSVSTAFVAGIFFAQIWRLSQPRIARLFRQVVDTLNFQKAPSRSFLSSLECVIFDCDGVLYRGKTALPEATTALSILRGAGLRLLFITNNATVSRASLASKLAAMGFEGVSAADCVTSASAAASYLATKQPHVKRVYVVAGGTGLREELAHFGVEAVGAEDDVKGLQARQRAITR